MKVISSEPLAWQGCAHAPLLIWCMHGFCCFFFQLTPAVYVSQSNQQWTAQTTSMPATCQYVLVLSFLQVVPYTMMYTEIWKSLIYHRSPGIFKRSPLGLCFFGSVTVYPQVPCGYCYWIKSVLLTPDSHPISSCHPFLSETLNNICTKMVDCIGYLHVWTNVR